MASSATLSATAKVSIMLCPRPETQGKVWSTGEMRPTLASPLEAPRLQSFRSSGVGTRWLRRAHRPPLSHPPLPAIQTLGSTVTWESWRATVPPGVLSPQTTGLQFPGTSRPDQGSPVAGCPSLDPGFALSRGHAQPDAIKFPTLNTSPGSGGGFREAKGSCNRNDFFI